MEENMAPVDGLAPRMTANRKWLALAIDILCYETEHWSDGNLLSEACDSWIDKHPILARTIIVSAGTLITVHLANLLRDEYDAFVLLPILAGRLFQRGSVESLQD
jgi:hypothetical protein